MPALSFLAEQSTNSTTDAINVICAWPVSGQYGVGSRVLYYALVAACVFARREEWLRNACLAAALLVPAVAALHGIVLAADHVHGAVDMDLYGAFQLCSVGVLAAPLTVRLSQTYFNNPGRNIIFLWSLIILAVAQGPSSSLRGGSADNIYVIPAPTVLSFGAATLLSGGCCIPAILLLVSMWIKIVQINWKTRVGLRDKEKIDTTHDTSFFERLLKLIRKHPEVPIFGGAIFTILIIGERNLFSAPVRYQTEPITNVGQWGPLVGTGLAIFGSLYMLIANEMNRQAKLSHVGHDRRASAELRGVDSATAHGYGIVYYVARRLSKWNNYFGVPNKARFDESDFQRGRAGTEYPTTPGEEFRHRNLSRLRTGYSSSRRSEDSPRSPSPASPRAESTTVTPKGVSPHRRIRSDTLTVPEAVHTPPARTTSYSPYEDMAMQTVATPQSQDAPPMITVSRHVDQERMDEYP